MKITPMGDRESHPGAAAEAIWSKSLAKPTFFESVERGSFELFNFSLSMRNEALAWDSGAVRAEPEQVRLERWVERTAYFHEVRHYHDLIGSVCGLHILLEATRLVDETLWLRSHGDPSAVATAVRAHKEFVSFILGAQTPDQVESVEAAHRELPVREFVYRGFQTVTVMVPIVDQDPRTGEVGHLWYRFGMRALMEHIGTELQIFIAAIGAGSDPHASDSAGTVERAHSAWGSLKRRRRHVYMLCHEWAMLQQATQRRATGETTGWDWARATPPLGDITILAAMALDLSGYAPVRDSRGNVQWQFEHPGAAFANLLLAWAELGDRYLAIDSLADELAQKVLRGQRYSTWLAAYNRSLQLRSSIVPEDLRPSSAHSSQIRAIREFVIAEHVQIMQAKQSNLTNWLLPPEYIRQLAKFPIPPLQEVAGRPIHSRPNKVVELVRTWNSLLKQAEEVLNG